MVVERPVHIISGAVCKHVCVCVCVCVCVLCGSRCRHLMFCTTKVYVLQFVCMFYITR